MKWGKLFDKSNGYLLGEEGFESFKEAAHSQSISQFDTAVHGGAGQAKQFANRVAQLFYTINYLPMFLQIGENKEGVAQKQRKK